MSNSKWAPEDKKQQMKTTKPELKPNIPTFAGPMAKPPAFIDHKEEALRAAERFFERFAGFALRPPLQNETAAQYKAYISSRLQPLIDASETIKKMVQLGKR